MVWDGQAIESLADLFEGVLLPDRKLRFLEEQPLGALPSGKDGLRHLLLFHFEDCLKKR